MSNVSLADVKVHLRVTDTSEDTLIQSYIDAAEDYVGNFLNCDNYPQNPSIEAAIYLIVGDLYENREAHTDKSVNANSAVMQLLYPYRQEIGI